MSRVYVGGTEQARLSGIEACKDEVNGAGAGKGAV